VNRRGGVDLCDAAITTSDNSVAFWRPRLHIRSARNGHRIGFLPRAGQRASTSARLFDRAVSTRSTVAPSRGAEPTDTVRATPIDSTASRVAEPPTSDINGVCACYAYISVATRLRSCASLVAIMVFDRTNQCPLRISFVFCHHLGSQNWRLQFGFSTSGFSLSTLICGLVLLLCLVIHISSTPSARS
jgi:hypothetical protein